MPIAEGDRWPELELNAWTRAGKRETVTAEFFAGRRVALFGVPGAFTSTCSETHLPGFLVRADDLAAAGIDEIVCTAVNDLDVMAAWASASGAAGRITMLADGSGELARALDLELDLSAFGMGVRSRRYAAVIDDGVVGYLGAEPGRDVGVSSAEAVLAALRASAD